MASGPRPRHPRMTPYPPRSRGDRSLVRKSSASGRRHPRTARVSETLAARHHGLPLPPRTSKPHRRTADPLHTRNALDRAHGLFFSRNAVRSRAVRPVRNHDQNWPAARRLVVARTRKVGVRMTDRTITSSSRGEHLTRDEPSVEPESSARLQGHGQRHGVAHSRNYRVAVI